jgi:hypothetical protein
MGSGEYNGESRPAGWEGTYLEEKGPTPVGEVMSPLKFVGIWTARQFTIQLCHLSSLQSDPQGRRPTQIGCIVPVKPIWVVNTKTYILAMP